MIRKYLPILTRPLQKLQRIAAICKATFKKRPYLMITLIFITWVLFFDSADLTSQYKLTRRINKLLAEQTYYQKQIAIMQAEQQALMSSDALLEKFAREKYFMRKPTEDLYIVIAP